MKARVTASASEAYPGISQWLLGVSPDQDFEMTTFAHVFQSCSQDSLPVQEIMSNVLGKLKEVMPMLSSVYYRQDNDHLDCSRHVCSLEQESMIDKAVRGYAARLEGQFAGAPQLRDRARAGREAQSTHQSPLTMGWALKSSQVGKTRFSGKQGDYLTSKFLIGGETGQNASPAQVS